MAGSYFFKNTDRFEAEVKAYQAEGENGKEKQHGYMFLLIPMPNFIPSCFLEQMPIYKLLKISKLKEPCAQRIPNSLVPILSI
ncbi:MAG: hypothetical protein L6Q97_24055 [Thermoanaerobaculia bacterium]|nr:hypothetical protein [Thermoanaerobaculia bacterium]